MTHWNIVLAKITCMAFLVAGIALMVTSADAEKSGQGTTLTGERVEQELRFEQGSLHAAAQAVQNGSMAELALGMLLVLFGLGVYAFFLVQKEDERPVHVTQLPKRKIDRNDLSKTRTLLEIFWIQKL